MTCAPHAQVTVANGGHLGVARVVRIIAGNQADRLGEPLVREYGYGCVRIMLRHDLPHITTQQTSDIINGLRLQVTSNRENA